MMKLTVLADNHTLIDRYYLGEPALSFYIEDGTERILFDTGYSDVLIRNARTAGIDLSRLNSIVISHGHNDHTGGLRYLFDSADLSGVKLIGHPGIFQRRIADGLEVGSAVSLKECLDHGMEYIDGSEPVRVSEHLLFLGEIRRQTAFEAKTPVGRRETARGFEPDYVMDDSALAYEGENGPFVITGCSHSGICNIILQALSLCGHKKAAGVIGGFHLMQDDDVTEQTVSFLKNHTAGPLYPCHCVCLKAKCRIMQCFDTAEVGSGMTIEIP